MSNTFKRAEYTTKGADPTVVVTWKSDAFALEEFQGVIRVEPAAGGTAAEQVQALGEALHAALERAYTAEQDLAATGHGDDVESCPGCGCKPGDGITPGCDDPDGCGYFKR